MDISQVTQPSLPVSDAPLGDSVRDHPLAEAGGDGEEDDAVEQRQQDLHQPHGVLQMTGYMLPNYRVTHLHSKNLLLTWIWDVLPSCLGSR